MGGLQNPSVRFADDGKLLSLLGIEPEFVANPITCQVTVPIMSAPYAAPYNEKHVENILTRNVRLQVVIECTDGKHHLVILRYKRQVV